MTTAQKQDQFIKLVKAKLSDIELHWLVQKTAILSHPESIEKFPLFFSLVSRSVSGDIPKWDLKELVQMEQVYPGFGKSSWTKQEMVRVILMIVLDTSKNKQVLESFFETAEMKELMAFFKGLYLLENAEEFTNIVEEGIRTNMENVFSQNIPNQTKLKKRMELIKQLATDLNKHFLFRDTLNFNFLLHLYSSKLEDLYNHGTEMSDGAFTERIELLDQSLIEMQEYIIE